MTEYIDKSLLRQKMYHAAFETDTDLQRWDSGCWIRYKMFENIIDAIPAADVRPVVRGKWIDCNRTLDDSWIFRKYICPLCDCIYFGVIRNFCPNCGADMREEQA